MYRIPVLVIAFGLLSPNLGRADDPVKDLTAVMVSGRWVFDHGKPPLVDRHVYTFAKDGTYTFKLVTDHPTEAKTGRWELVTGKNSKIQVRMTDPKGPKDQKDEKDQNRAKDSDVRYDPKKDVLIISGGRFAELTLRHEKGK